MQIVRYPIHNKILNNVAEFVWHLTSDIEENIDNKLLPVINTDLIINLSSPIHYRFDGGIEEQAPPVHIRYVKKRSQVIFQSGSIDVWGVSLYPYGVYPFLQVSMSKQEGQIIDLRHHNHLFVTSVLSGLKNIDSSLVGSEIIENALCNWLGSNLDFAQIDILRTFVQNMDSVRIRDYCSQQAINIKQLERLIKKYVGVTPKQLQQIRRFQKVSNELIYSTSIPTFADIAYSHEYFDQTHFTKDFKEYSNQTPSVFVNEHNSVKGNINHTEKR